VKALGLVGPPFRRIALQFHVGFLFAVPLLVIADVVVDRRLVASMKFATPRAGATCEAWSRSPAALAALLALSRR
jgi:hypothetical protein